MFVFEAVFLPIKSFSGDQQAYRYWAENIYREGIGNAYNCTKAVFNYPPLIAYPLWVFAKLQINTSGWPTHFYYFKLFPLLFDFISVVYLIRRFAGKKNEIILLIITLGNPLFIFNSYCWGQMDTVMSALIFFSVVAALYNRAVLSVLFFTLAINFKAQAVIFVAPLGLLWLWKFFNRAYLRAVITALLAAAVTEFVIVLPFIVKGEFTHMINTLYNSVDFFPYISLRAYNLWYLIGPSPQNDILDSNIFIWGVTYKQFGMLLFCTFSFIVLFPFFLGF